MPTNQARAYTASHFALELDGAQNVGFIRSVEGGNIKAEVMTYQAGNKHDVWRQLGRPKIEDLKLQVGMSMSKSFYTWLSGFFTGDVQRKSGAILAGDFNYEEQARRTFYDAVINAIDFPKLDGSDKNACYMTVTLTPERMEFEKGKKNKLDATVGQLRQKYWTAANFRFRLDGLEDACARVTQVDGFSIKQKMLEYPSGNSIHALRVPSFIEWPNLSVYVPEVDAQPFIDHFTKHIIKGEVQSTRGHGYLGFLDHKGFEMAELELFGVDIISVTPDKSDATSDDIKKVKVELSLESMKFVYGDAAALE
jgi:phage tail-like protein